MGIGIKELLVILVVVLLVFGTKRLRNVGTDLGAAIKGFSKSMNDEEQEKDPALSDKSQATQAADAIKTKQDEKAQ